MTRKIDWRNLPRLPVNYSYFEEIRKEELPYVDKTDLIYKLARSRGQIFLARPPKFGKTLILSTFDSLFSKGLSDFHGLKIEHLWEDPYTYKVITLAMYEVSEFDTVEEFQEKLDKYLESLIPDQAFVTLQRSTGRQKFISWLACRSEASIVILIDDSDLPVLNLLGYPEKIQKVGKILGDFYSKLIELSPIYRFIFITGITNLAMADLIEKEKVQDISLSPEFGAIAGFTLDEILYYFNMNLNYACEVLKGSKEEVLRALEKHNGGFCFESSATIQVLNPESVIWFLHEPELGVGKAWGSMGDFPSSFYLYAEKNILISLKTYGRPLMLTSQELSSDFSLLEKPTSDYVLLGKLGMLTIQGRVSNVLFLDFPNPDVAFLMSIFTVKKYLKGNERPNPWNLNIYKVLKAGDKEKFVSIINKAFSRYNPKTKAIVDQETCMGFLILLLQDIGTSYWVNFRYSSSGGYLNIRSELYHWLVGVDYITSEQEEISVQKYLNQPFNPFEPQGSKQNVYQVLMFYSAKKNRFVNFITNHFDPV